MNSKYTGKYTVLRCQLTTFIVLSFFMLPIYADVSVNNVEKNDKITNGQLTVTNVVSEQAVNEQSVYTDRSAATDDAESWELRAEAWEIVRNGNSILSLPVLHQLINAWLQDRDRKIEIQYPGGEEGEFWVQELADWLVTLGIPSANMITVAGSGADDMIRFSLMR